MYHYQVNVIVLSAATVRAIMVMKPVAETVPGDGSWRDALPDFRSGFKGDIIGPDDPIYEAARKVWNGMIDRRPALIVRPSGVADVVCAVDFARDHGIRLAVRGGGHNVAGNAVCDDGIVVDLSRMKGIRIDPAARTAWAQAGVLWGEFDRETQVHGLATTGGLVSSTGIAGFTLGGGIGWLMRSRGLASDNLVSADIVTADGRVLRASATEHADLFWGLRGGGGNFGIATAFEFRLHPIGKTVYGGVLFHPAEKAADFLRFFGEYVKHIPDSLTTMVVLVTAPRAPFLPAEIHGKRVVGFVACHAGSPEKGERLLKPVREFAPPVADLFGPMPYLALQTMFDPGNPPGSFNYWKSHYLSDLSEDAIQTVVTHAGRMPSPISEVHVQHLEGAVARVKPDESAFANREAPFVLNVVGKWSESKENDRGIRWVREFWDAMRPFATGGVYVNFLADASEEMVKAAYGSGQYERLAALKRKYDPTNFFRLNHNVAPKDGGSRPQS